MEPKTPRWESLRRQIQESWGGAEQSEGTKNKQQGETMSLLRGLAGPIGVQFSACREVDRMGTGRFAVTRLANQGPAKQSIRQ